MHMSPDAEKMPGYFKTEFDKLHKSVYVLFIFPS